MTAHLITPAELDAERDARGSGDRPAVILDVRWRLDAPDGRPAYLEGHIPGAVYVSLDDELADHEVRGEGRHPLPTPEAFQAAVRRWGIDDGDEVVVYDDWMGFGAARAWWMLTDAGIAARVLDGGLGAWRVAGLPLETGEGESGRPATEPGTATVRPGHLPRLSIDEAAALAAGEEGVLLDARAGERYRGDVEPMDPRAGHIPGAVSAPTTENLQTDGTLRRPAELSARFDALGVGVDGGRVGVYCGSGVSAAQQVLALAVAGRDAALYVGSWSQWSSDAVRPVATGPTP